MSSVHDPRRAPRADEGTRAGAGLELVDSGPRQGPCLSGAGAGTGAEAGREVRGRSAGGPESSPGALLGVAGSLGARRIGVGAGLLVLVLVLSPVTLADAVVAWDLRVFRAFLSVRSEALTVLMRTVTAVFAPSVCVVWALAVGALVSRGTGSRRQGVLIPASMALSAVVTAVIKLGVERLRPPEVDRLVVEHSHSFPSGHTTAAATLAVCLVILARMRSARRLGGPRRLVGAAWAVGVGLTALIAVSRMYVGAHWFSDVVAGAMIGTGTTLLVAGVVFADEARAD
ncbi:phosphatase PAP2 family protein [Actinomyces sp. B33]|uniref:phosphatase PAP2 family protein n=1 Tax=Actinomyces sp. B33 TaxID=2942131 RepID=UPI002341B372|nr:phosphatase PAP2 family protein [Actinomyces sp. B33]MDC4232564.1 phosphatase PAP2 family protein [Actinomyces sp. B33]